MITEPKVERRDVLYTLGIRTQVPMDQLSAIVQPYGDEAKAWMVERGIPTDGLFYIRYYRCDMDKPLDIEIGWLVNAATTGDDRVQSNVFPSGDYAAMTYTGDYDGLFDATTYLEEWAQRNRVKWDRRPDEHGEFQSRFEFYITDPVEEPDPQKWETEVLIKVAE